MQPHGNRKRTRNQREIEAKSTIHRFQQSQFKIIRKRGTPRSDPAIASSPVVLSPPLAILVGQEESSSKDSKERMAGGSDREILGTSNLGNNILHELWLSSALLLSSRISWLLLLGPLALLGDSMGIFGEAICFALSGIALIPCAERYETVFVNHCLVLFVS